MENNKLIDLSYLEQVCGGNKSMVYKMIDLFLQQTPLQITQMQENLKAKDWENFFTIAHKAKSSLAMMGVKSLHQHMEDLEDYSKNQRNLNLIPALLDHVTEKCHFIIKEIKTNYNSLCNQSA